MKLFSPRRSPPAGIHRRGTCRRPLPGPQPGRHLRQLPRHQRHAVKGSGMDALAACPRAPCRSWRIYKSGDKPASIMHQIAKGYTEAQLDLIAGYFAAQK